MRKGGLLDGFPMHFFAGGSDEAVMVIVDNPDLGWLHLNPVPEGHRMIIALAKERECLEKTQEAMGDFEEARIHLVQADPKRLPFRDQSIEGVVTLSSGKAKAERNTVGDGTLATGSGEFARILTPTGRLVEVIRTLNWRTMQQREKSMGWTKTGCYYVRPASGRQHFVTREWTPSPWPFRPLQVGRLQSVRISADLLVSRLGIRPLYDSVSLMVRSRTRTPALLERWTGVTDGSEYGGVPRLSSHGGFGLFVKAGRNALLLGVREPRPSGSPVMVKFPLNVVAAARLKNHSDTLDALNAKGNLELRTVLPKVVDRGTVCGQAYWIETRCEGVTASNFW